MCYHTLLNFLDICLLQASSTYLKNHFHQALHSNQTSHIYVGDIQLYVVDTLPYRRMACIWWISKSLELRSWANLLSSLALDEELNSQWTLQDQMLGQTDWLEENSLSLDLSLLDLQQLSESHLSWTFLRQC